MQRLTQALLASMHRTPMRRIKSLTPKHMREKKIYLDLTRFKGQDALLLYKSREKWFFLLVSMGLVGMVGFNLKSYYDQRYSLELDSSDVLSPLYVSGGLTLVFLALQYRIYKSPIKILLHRDG